MEQATVTRSRIEFEDVENSIVAFKGNKRATEEEKRKFAKRLMQDSAKMYLRTKPSSHILGQN